MKMKMRAILSAIAPVLFAASGLHAAEASATASATLMMPISIVRTADLSFGKFSAATGGTISISAAGARTVAGAVVVSSMDEGGAAAFSVAGDPNATYTITLPSAAMLTHAGDQTKTMSVGSFASHPFGMGLVSGGGHQTLSVGATLTVGPNQPDGAYSGTFDVAIEYN